MKICYHGTNKTNADRILKEGFKPYTYFSRHLESALCYGGEWVFEVCFDETKVPDNWQFIIKTQRGPENIVGLKHYKNIELIKENKELRNKIFEYQLSRIEKEKK